MGSTASGHGGFHFDCHWPRTFCARFLLPLCVLVRGKRVTCLLRFTLLSLPFALCGGSVSIQAQLHLFLQPSQFVSALISGFVSTISILVQGLSFVGHHSMCWHRWDPASMIHPDTLYTSIAALPVQLVLCDGRSKWEAPVQWLCQCQGVCLVDRLLAA